VHGHTSGLVFKNCNCGSSCESCEPSFFVFLDRSARARSSTYRWARTARTHQEWRRWWWGLWSSLLARLLSSYHLTSVQYSL